MKTVTVFVVVLIFSCVLNVNAQITTVWEKDSTFSSHSLGGLTYPLEQQTRYFVKYNDDYTTAYILDPNSLELKYTIDLSSLGYINADVSWILPDLNNNGHEEIVLYTYGSLTIIDAQSGDIIKEWKATSTIYFENHFYLINGSNKLTLLIRKYDNTSQSSYVLVSQTLYDLGVSVNPTSIRDNNSTINNFVLRQNYPNPFNPSTTIKYSLPKSANVEVQIYNSIGQRIKTLVNQFQSNGEYSLQWDGNNDFGQKAASGTYIYQINVDGRLQTKKMMLLK